MASHKGIPPVIIIGMHRSGTSMTSRLLEQLGLFVGYEKESNNEAVFFLKTNKEIFSSVDATWLHFDPFYEKLRDEKTKTKWVEMLRKKMISHEVVSFLGDDLYQKYKTIFSIDFPWGWKEPRTTVTLPLWLNIFPNSKILHIYRHGVDVANSLKVRYDEHQSRFKERRLVSLLYSPIKLLRYVIKYKKLPSRQRTKYYYNKSISAKHLMGLEVGLSLWERYMDIGLKYVEDFADRTFNIKYEDLLDKPESLLETMAEFCGLQTTSESIQKAASMVNKTRRYAYLNDPNLVAFEQQVKKRLNKYGY